MPSLSHAGREMASVCGEGIYEAISVVSLAVLSSGYSSAGRVEKVRFGDGMSIDF